MNLYSLGSIQLALPSLDDRLRVPCVRPAKSRSHPSRRFSTLAVLLLLSLMVPVPAQGQLARVGASVTETAAPLRNQAGRRVTVVCPAITAQQAAGVRIWGTNVYTDDSAICVAAIHAGALPYGTAAAVTIILGAGANSFSASTQNGVTSQSYGSWGYSFEFDRSGAPGQVDWSTTGQGIPPELTSPIPVECPAGGATMAPIWGTDIYTIDSSICVAAVHSGLFASAGAGGRIAVVGLPGQPSYAASSRNGVQSQAWSSYSSSFRVTGDTTSSTPGSGTGSITGFTVAPNPKWGAVLSWDPAPSITWYAIERSEAGQAFVRDNSGGVPTLNTQGRLEWFDFALKPGTHYDYKVSALNGGSGGPVLFSSNPQGFDSQGTYPPALTNMTATVSSNVEILGVPVDGQGRMENRPARRVSWTWDLVPNYPTYMATFDRNSTGARFRWPPNPIAFRPPNEIPIEAGQTVRFCASIVTDPSLTSPKDLLRPTCVDTFVPPAPPVTGVPVDPPTPTGIAVGVPVRDATPPTVQLTPQPAGFLLTWPATPNATRYTICRESPPASPCNPIDRAASHSSGTYSFYDIGVVPGSPHLYRVSAWRSDGHFGESAVTGTAGDIPPPTEISIGSRDASTGFLRWRPALIPTMSGDSRSFIQYHQLTGPGLPAQIINGAETAVPIPPGRNQYVWAVCSMLANPAGGWWVSGTATTLTYDGPVFSGRLSKGTAPCIPSREILQGTVMPTRPSRPPE